MNLIRYAINYHLYYTQEIKKNYNKYFNKFINFIERISIINRSYLHCQLSTRVKRNQKESNLYY
jgi:hypothetical protein